MKVYLDNAATTPVAPEVVEAMLPYLTEKFGNPSSIHAFGREVKVAIEKARKAIAAYLNTSPGEIFFTSGGTESVNMVTQGAVKTIGVKHVITSPLEHHCVLHPLEALEKEGEIKLSYVALKEDGKIDYADLEKKLVDIPEKVLVCLMHVNNEIGNITDMDQVAAICQENNALFLCDTVQSIAHFKIDLQATPVDFMTGSAHKFHGPKGVGFLYIKSDAQITPLIYGGAQERNMRAGTENITGIVGMHKAIELGYDNLEKDSAYVADLKQYFFNNLKAAIPEIEINGSLDDSTYTVLNVSFPPIENADFLLYNLDMAEIAVSAGSACSSGSNAGSHVLQAINADPTRSSVRFSFSHYNTKAELDFVVEKLKAFFVVPSE